MWRWESESQIFKGKIIPLQSPGIVKSQRKGPEARMCPESLRRLLCHGREERVVDKIRMIAKMHNVYDLRCCKDFGFYVMNGKQLGVLNRREVTQSCPTLCDPMDCSLPGSSLHGIFQTRILEWVFISFSRRSSQTRDWTWVSRITDRCFTVWATREEVIILLSFKNNHSGINYRGKGMKQGNQLVNVCNNLG